MSNDLHHPRKLTLGVWPHCRQGEWVPEMISRWDTRCNHNIFEQTAARETAAQAITEDLKYNWYTMSRLGGVRADPENEKAWTKAFREAVTGSIAHLKSSRHNVFEKVAKIVVLSSESELSSFANTKPEHCNGDQWNLFQNTMCQITIQTTIQMETPEPLSVMKKVLVRKTLQRVLKATRANRPPPITPSQTFFPITIPLCQVTSTILESSPSVFGPTVVKASGECEAAYNAAAQAINETLGSDRYAMSRLDGVNADPKSEADWTMGFREVVTRSINILRLSGHDVFDKVDKIVVLSSASELSSFANTKPEHCSGDQWTLFEYEEPFERLDDDSDDDSNGTMEFPVDKKVVDEKDFEDEAAEGEVDEEEVVDEEVGR
ncbi:MAG: hypothetical protein TREMPRED_000964, partial [Tremellales sp. Tagirdzhanova-0007]